MLSTMTLITGRASYYLARRIRDELRTYDNLGDLRLGEPYVVKFANDNLKIKILDSVRGTDVFVIQSAVPEHLSGNGLNPEVRQREGIKSLGLSESLLELLITVDALKAASAGRITVVCPYFPYTRSDKKDEPRISITSRLMADLLREAGADRFLTINLHALQIQGFFRVPCDQLDANPLIARYFSQTFDCGGIGVLATDAGGVKIATVYAEQLGLPLAVCDKRRVKDKADPIIRNVIGISGVKDREIAIFDDEIMTGGTMCRAIDVLAERFGLSVTYVSCVHPVLADRAIESIFESGVCKLVTTDTLPLSTSDDRIHVVSTAALLARAIFNIHTHKSVTQIFKENRDLFDKIPRTLNMFRDQ